MSTSAPFCLPSNPDISGIGIRVSIYAQNLLSFVPAVLALLDGKVTPTELETLETQSSTILITAFAVIVSTGVQSFAGRLTRYHVAIILNLSLMNNTNLFIYLLLYIYHRTCALQQESIGNSDDVLTARRVTFSWRGEVSRSLMSPVFMIGWFHMFIMSLLGLALWGWPNSFKGALPCLESSSVAIIGLKIPLRSQELRASSLVFYSLCPFIPPLLATVVGPLYMYHFANLRPSGSKPSIKPIYASILALSIVDSMLLADTELTIAWNAHKLMDEGDSEWTFGQVLALLMVLVPIRDLVETLLQRRPRNLGKRLLAAVEEGQLDVVRYVGELGPDPHAKEKSLRVATEKGSLDTIMYLVRIGGNIHAKDWFGRTALHVAAAKGHFDTANFLIEQGVDVNAKDGGNQVALHTAAEHGHGDIVELLLEHGANINVRGWNSSIAPYWEDKDKERSATMIQWLYEQGAKFSELADVRRFKSGTALHFAAMRGHEGVVKLLLDRGIDISAADYRKCRTALHEAALRGHMNIVRILIEHGAYVNAKDKQGRNAHYLASKKGHVEVAMLLLSYAANLHGKANTSIQSQPAMTTGLPEECSRWIDKVADQVLPKLAVLRVDLMYGMNTLVWDGIWNIVNLRGGVKHYIVGG